MTRLFSIAIALICLGLGSLRLAALGQPAANEEMCSVFEDDKEIEKKPGLREVAAVNADPGLLSSPETLAFIGMLKQTIETRGLTEKVKLKVALEYFADKFGGKLPIMVDREAFAEGFRADAADPYEEEVVLPAVPTKMTMGTALRLILTQVGKGEATFLIRQGHLEIVPKSHATAKGLLKEPVVLAVENRTLQDVLLELSDLTGMAISIDPNLGKKASAQITATFRNTCLEDALVTVTEMADLKFVVMANSVYVTTPARAEAIEKEEKKRQERREPMKVKRCEKD